MFRFSISSLLRFLAGIFLVQVATGLLVYSGLRTDQAESWLLFSVLALLVGALSSFWFASVAGHLCKDQLVREREGFSREREQIRVRAEREKTKVIKQSHQQITKERNRVQSKATMKVGVAFAGAVGLGLVMMLTQFVTLGLLTVTTAGGAVGGYLYRGRRDQKAIEGQSPGGGLGTLTRALRTRLPKPGDGPPSRLIEPPPGKPSDRSE